MKWASELTLPKLGKDTLLLLSLGVGTVVSADYFARALSRVISKSQSDQKMVSLLSHPGATGMVISLSRA